MLQKSKQELRHEKPDRKGYRQLEKHPVSVLMEKPESAYNIGVMFRLCEALLLEKLHLSGNCPLPPGMKISKTSRGAEKWLSWEHWESAMECVMEHKLQGYNIVSVELAHGSTPVEKTPLAFPSLFVFGNESAGVSEPILALSDQIIHIPIEGMANSLNVTTAASITLYQAVMQIREHKRVCACS